MIGLRIASLRKSQLLSQKELSHGITSVSHLSNFESCRYMAGRETIELIAERLNVSPKYLLSYNDPNIELEAIIKNIFKKIVLKNVSVEDELKSIPTPIYNLKLEVSYYLLLASFYYKKGELTNARHIDENYLKVHLKYLKNHKEDLDSPLKEYLYYYWGIKFFRENKFSLSNIYFSKLIEINFDKDLEPAFLYNLALLQFRLTNYYQALSHAKKALENYLNALNWLKVGEIYNFISVIYREQFLFDEALEQLNKALNIAKTMGLATLKGSTYHNIGLIYEDLNDFDAALLNYQHAIQFKTKMSNFITYSCLIRCHIKMKHYDLSEDLINKTLKNITNPYELNILESYQAYIDLYRGNIDTFLNKSLKSSEFFENNNFLNEAQYLNTIIGEAYYEDRKYKLSSIYLKKALYLKRKSKGG
ncbi:tetratricopeptide repeat protein [Viridibacillus arvi]|uniref:helix-turn-helix domain-containing protein n=1 Tax=Viridibacillus arvi TaxID=263475 RepID=UPI003D07548B